jgi:hypothetical protein
MIFVVTRMIFAVTRMTFVATRMTFVVTRMTFVAMEMTFAAMEVIFVRKVRAGVAIAQVYNAFSVLLDKSSQFSILDLSFREAASFR